MSGDFKKAVLGGIGFMAAFVVGGILGALLMKHSLRGGLLFGVIGGAVGCIAFGLISYLKLQRKSQESGEK